MIAAAMPLNAQRASGASRKPVAMSCSAALVPLRIAAPFITPDGAYHQMGLSNLYSIRTFGKRSRHFTGTRHPNRRYRTARGWHHLNTLAARVAGGAR